jgi:hypothetical protein
VPPVPTAPGLPLEPQGELGGTRTLHDAKRLNELEVLRERRRERAIAEGLLVSREAVEREAFRLARSTLDRALGMVDRIAPILAAHNDAAEVATLLEAELRAVFAEIAARAVESPPATAEASAS